ncbi:MAG: hypothetical protein RL660_535 [Bacteroidota bacterium]|jgi:phage baseplate assembly protein W
MAYKLYFCAAKHLRNTMKKALSFSTLAAMLLFAACSGGSQMSAADIDKKVDETAKTQIEAAEAKAISDCEARKATEVRLKSDSMVANKR